MTRASAQTQCAAPAAGLAGAEGASDHPTREGPARGEQPAQGEVPARPDPRPAPESEMIMHLEPDQLVAETFRPVPPARLGTRATVGLWTLRVFVVLVSVLVVYTFVARL